jgi:hypothetical protein
MLRISAPQRQKLADPAFVDRVVAHFRRWHTQAVAKLSDVVLRRRVVHGIAKGRGYGLTWEYSLSVFLAHMIKINPEFDKQRTIQRILRDPSREQSARLDALIGEVSRDEWEEAARQCDAVAYWREIDGPSSEPRAPASGPGKE